MTVLRLIREPTLHGATLGSLYVNDTWQCWTLEREAAIPASQYQVGLTKSQRFGMVLPEVLNVPGFTGIRIHAGNTSADTEGCILVGHSRGDARVIDSRLALTWLMQRLKADALEPLMMQIENPLGLHLFIPREEK